MALYTINYLELCAGTGMLGVAVELALKAIGVRAVPVCYIEREAVAAASLVARMEVTGMGFAPIWDDIGTFDCGPWRGLVDCVCGGYPCQPFSVAGKRLGEKDPRHLWPRIREIVAGIQPSFCFFENVPGHLISGFDRVIDDLEGLDYRVAAGLFTSEEVGAPMRNERLYILAATNGGGRRAQNDGKQQDQRIDRSNCTMASAQNPRNREHQQGMGEGSAEPNALGADGAELAPAPSERREKSRFAGEWKLQEESGKGLDHRPEFNGCELATANSLNLQGRPDIGQIQIQVAEQPDTERTGGGLDWHYPPARNDWRSWAVVASLETARMPAVERSLCAVAYGMASRADQLRLIGNGVDPLAAAYAFLHLLAHFEKG